MAFNTETKSDIGLNNVNNTSDMQKPVSTAQAAAIAAIVTSVNSMYVNGTLYTGVKSCSMNRNVASGGSVVFYLTDDGTASGNAIFQNNVFKSTANFWADDVSNQYQMGSYSLSADRKVLTLTVNRLGSVLLGIIQFLASATGTTIYMTIRGN